MNILKLLKQKTLIVLKGLVKNYVPRSIIFSIDTIIVFLAAQFTFYLISTISKSEPQYFNLSLNFWAIFGIQIIIFILLKSYAGIIRYTGFRDAIKQLQTTILAVICILVINQICFQTFGKKLY